MLIDVLVAFSIALIITLVFATALGTTGPWSGAWVFFVIVLLFTWAIGLWVRPVGPALWGVYWLPYLFFGVIVALLLAGAAPVRGPGTRSGRVGAPSRPLPGDADELAAEEGTAVAVGVFVWVAFVVLVVAIAVGYLW